MDKFEYKAIPAPVFGQRAKGVRGNDGRFAQAMSTTLNQMSLEGWEYIRAESLPANERRGVFRRRVQTHHNLLIFRRPADETFVASQETQGETSTFNPFRRSAVKTETAQTETEPAPKDCLLYTSDAADD